MRRFYYIRPNIQNAFTLLYTFITAIEIVLFGLALRYIEGTSLHFAVDLRIYWKYSVLVVLLLGISALNFWIGARLSHRIAGPLIQIQRVLQQAIMGNYKQRISLRSSDYLHEIGDMINVLMEKLDHSRNLLADKHDATLRQKYKDDLINSSHQE